MNRTIARASASVGVLAAVLALTPTSAHAGVAPSITVTGTAVCDTAGPVGRYTLNWTVTNNVAAPTDIDGAVESGAFTGTVTIAPNPIPASGAGTGSDGPVPGSTTGTVTLTVDASIGAMTTQETGTIQLAGNCVIPTTTTTSTSTSTTSTSSTSTTSTIRAVAVTPRFAG